MVVTFGECLFQSLDNVLQRYDGSNLQQSAKELHDKGGDLIEATIEASRMRLRPILMTSLAFLLGILPLAISTGAGAGGQNAIGTGVMGGTFAATVLGIFFVPVFFVLVFRLFNRKAREGRGTAVAKEKR